MSNENSFRRVGAGINFLSPTDFIVEVDTSAGAVTLILPKIATILSSFTTIQQFIGIRFVDISNNASVNNITVEGFETDSVNGESSIILNTNGAGGLATLIGGSQWSFQKNSTSSDGGGIVEYKQALLPTTSLAPQSLPKPNLVGKVFDLGKVIFSSYPFIELENGNLATILYCQSVLTNGILIYEAFDEETLSGINGYWIAFKQNEQNPKLLEKVGELQMTQQFWDNWYDWTVKDSGDNTVKFVYANQTSNNSDPIESFITTLTYSNGVLTATDSGFDFGGATVLSLYNSLSGYNILGGLWDSKRTEYILDDDYYGMAVGTQVGWCYYRDVNGGLTEQWDCVGFNILTGETRWITTTLDIASNVTNFNFSGVDLGKYIVDWFNHPNGITFTFADAQILDEGDNVNGVTCIWSPFYQNPNEVIYINSRNSETGEFIYTNGSLNPFVVNIAWYWDNENIYTYQWVNPNQARCLLVERFNTNTKEITSWNIPSFEDLSNAFVSSWANNNGLMLNINEGKFMNDFGYFRYNYFTNNDYPYILQSNNYYPTNIFGNKTYSVYSGLLTNVYNVGIEVDEYTDVQF
jgi:hypothetical protein